MVLNFPCTLSYYYSRRYRADNTSRFLDPLSSKASLFELLFIIVFSLVTHFLVVANRVENQRVENIMLSFS